MQELVLTPKGWIEAFGEIIKFGGTMVRDVATLRVMRFFGEALRQAGNGQAGAVPVADEVSVRGIGSFRAAAIVPDADGQPELTCAVAA